MINYYLSYPKPHTHTFNVKICPDNHNLDTLDFVMPVWIPGSYSVNDFSTNVHDVSIKGGKLSRVTKNRWRIFDIANKLEFSYSVFAYSNRVRESHLDESHALINPPSVLMYIDELKYDQITLHIKKLKSHKIFTTLQHKNRSFRANNYHDLYDSPIEIGNPSTASLMYKGKKVLFAIHGEHNCNIDQLKKDTRKLISATARVFNEIPYTKYIFFIHTTPDLTGMIGGGLEHRDSCCVVAKSNCFHPRSTYLSFMKLLSHEYFHLYNVKRLKPAEFQDYDYNKENYSKLLWFFEGFTDYMAYKLLLDSGIAKPEEFLKWYSSLMTNLIKVQGRLHQSLEESSFETWIKLYKPNQNSQNITVSYYLKGNITGLLTDILIRKSGSRKHSINDLFKSLYSNIYKRGKGVTYSDIKTTLKQLGCNTKDFTSWIETTRELPLKQYLKYCGLRLDEEYKENAMDYGITFKPNISRLIIKSINSISPFYKLGLVEGDELLAVNGFRVDQYNFNEVMSSLRYPGKLDITLFREHMLKNRKITLDKPTKKELKISRLKHLTPAQRKMQRGLLGKLIV